MTTCIELKEEEVDFLRKQLSDRLCEDRAKIDFACRKNTGVLFPRSFIENVSNRIEITERLLTKLS